VLFLCRAFPDLFPLTTYFVQTTLQPSAVVAGLGVLLCSLNHKLSPYTLCLLLLLTQAATVFFRLLFDRRD